MSAVAIATVLSVIVGAICLFDAYRWNQSGQNLYKFFLYEGRLRLPGYVSTLVAANLSLGNFIIFISTWGYSYGIAGLICFIINLGFNVLGFVLFFPKFKSYIEDHGNHGTIHDFLARTYGGDPGGQPARRIRLTASIVTIVCLVLAIVFELNLAAGLLSPESRVEQVKAFAGMLILIALFTSAGGFRSLVASDLANAIIMAISTIGLVSLIMYFSRGSEVAVLPLQFGLADFQKLGWPSILSIMIIGSGWMLVAMDQWQRTCASRSYETSARGLFFFFFILSFFAIAYALWGAFDKSILPSLVSSDVKNSLAGAGNPLMDIAAIPVSSSGGRFLVSFAIAGLIFAAVSTTNTFLTVCSHSFTTDVLVGSFANRSFADLSKRENILYVGIGRSVIVGITVIILIFGVVLMLGDVLKDPLSFFFIAYSVQFALLAPMVFSVLPMARRPTSTGALISIVIGFVTALLVGFGAWYLGQIGAGAVMGLPPSDWITLTPVVTLVIGSLPLLLLRREVP
jgi:Na+/proline symporter